METVTLDLGGCEIAECTPALRWVPKSVLGGQAFDFKLQQAFRMRAVDKDGRTMGSRIEWRDVPTVIE